MSCELSLLHQIVQSAVLCLTPLLVQTWSAAYPVTRSAAWLGRTALLHDDPEQCARWRTVSVTPAASKAELSNAGKSAPTNCAGRRLAGSPQLQPLWQDRVLPGEHRGQHGDDRRPIGREAGNMWHVHEHQVPSSGDYMRTGSHLDPNPWRRLRGKRGAAALRVQRPLRHVAQAQRALRRLLPPSRQGLLRWH